MSEARWLLLIVRYSHRTALARHVRDGSSFHAVARLEALGLVRRERDRYRLTTDGRNELAMSVRLDRLLTRTKTSNAI